jgi:hypothetical protein
VSLWRSRTRSLLPRRPPGRPLARSLLSRWRRARGFSVRLLIGWLALSFPAHPALPEDRAATGVGQVITVTTWSPAQLHPDPAPPPPRNAERGFAVACDGNLAAVGARFDGPHGGGAVYLFSFDGTQWHEMPLPPPPFQPVSPQLPPWLPRPAGEQFGISVALHGSLLVVGAPGEERDQGRPKGTFHVIPLLPVSQVEAAFPPRQAAAPPARAKTVAALPSGVSGLGRAVALDDARVAVSATLRDAVGDHGIVLLYALSSTAGDTPAAILQPEDPQPGDRFGESLALSGGTLVVGAPGHRGSAGQPAAGAAYIFLPATGTRQAARLQAADETAHAELGSAVGVSGTTVAVGAAGAPAPSSAGSAAMRSGAVYVFTLDAGAWPQQTKLAPGSPVAGERFGQAVALDRDTLVAGAPLHAAAASGTAGAAAGAIHFFARSGAAWSELPLGAGPAAVPHALYGFALAAATDLIVVGAPLANDTAGAAYAWTFGSTRSGAPRRPQTAAPR